jgi:hypothetical protein
VPYRNHKLTQLLSDSLGGVAKTLMVVNVSPGAQAADVEEGLMALKFATRANTITPSRLEHLQGIEGRKLLAQLAARASDARA